MGGSGEWPQQQSEFYPNGLLVEEMASVTRPLDPRLSAKAEASTAELISLIQPNRPSEMHRNAVAKYVQRLVSQCVPCQVFTFGSVPLKTYLPDGDIDLTAFSEDQTLKDNWAMKVRDMLEREEKNEHAEFPVKEVQYIQAEVKIIKCLVDNIVVDISFNQLGGLCTLCFLEEVDNLINHDHLFKRSVILIKAWCYYESRLLGAHHGLISTYALETLVLYIFHVFNNSFAGPLEVLYRFLEFFSKFDWANFCVSLWGPVPISSLPSMSADPPRKDGGELLLNKLFLNACSTVYSVFPAGQENLEQPFISKHFNVIDPLRLNNNLGRSVSKGNFYRIRSAFNLGAQQLARIFECQEGDIETELKQFFVNTWDRHGKGSRPDAPIIDASHISQVDLECNGDVEKQRVTDESTENFNGHEPKVDDLQHSLDNSMNSSSLFALHQAAKNTDAHRDLRARKQKDYDYSRSQMASGRHHHNTERNKLWKKQHDDIKRTCRLNILQTRGHASHHFARTSSSPELTSMSTEAASISRHNAETETSGSDANFRGRIGNGENMENHVVNCFTDEPFMREGLSRHSLASDSVNVLGGKSVSGSTKPVISSADESSQRHLGEQDFMYKLSPSGIQNYGRPVQMPANLASHTGVPFPPSVMGYSHQNYVRTKPTNFSVHESDRSTVLHYCNGPPYPAPFHPPEREVVGGLSEGALVHLREDSAFWNNGRAQSSRDIDPESEDFSTASSRLSPSSPAASSRSKAGSESSWDGRPAKPERYPLGKMSSPTVISSASVNSRLEDDRDFVDHTCDEINDDRKDWASLSTAESVAPSLPSSLVEVNQLRAFGQAHMSCQNAVSPFGPILLHPGSQQGVAHNHTVLPVAFYPPGPVPIVTMVPIYNMPAETGTSDAPASQDSVKKSAYFTNQSGHSLVSANELERLGHSGNDISRNRITSREHSKECGSDIFTSDFASHWNNLQFGRFCQSSHLRHPSMYPPSVVLPPQPSQGQIPFDAPPPRSPGRSNAFARVVPASAPQPGSPNPAGVSRHYDGEVLRQRNGTGTYFPNPKIIKERQYSTSRQCRGDFGRERNEDLRDREDTGNFNSKPRFSGRFHPRNQYEKPNARMERSATSSSQTDGSWRQNSNHLHHFARSKFPSRPVQYGAEDVDYTVYQMHPGHGDDTSSPGHALPPFVMLYPYPQAVPYGSWTEKLQFGSVRPEHFVGTEAQEVSGYPKGGNHELHNYQGATGPSSPNYASPPNFPCDGGI